jgi:hypothetical protein
MLDHNQKAKCAEWGGYAGDSLFSGEEYLNRSVCFVGIQTSPLLHPGRMLSHRKLSVFLAVLICLVTSSSIIFFLFPRSITAKPAGLNSSTVVFDDTAIHLNMTVSRRYLRLCPPAQSTSL